MHIDGNRSLALEHVPGAGVRCDDGSGDSG